MNSVSKSQNNKISTDLSAEKPRICHGTERFTVNKALKRRRQMLKMQHLRFVNTKHSALAGPSDAKHRTLPFGKQLNSKSLLEGRENQPVPPPRTSSPSLSDALKRVVPLCRSYCKAHVTNNELCVSPPHPSEDTHCAQARHPSRIHIRIVCC